MIGPESEVLPPVAGDVIRPFRIEIPETALEDLRERLA